MSYAPRYAAERKVRIRTASSELSHDRRALARGGKLLVEVPLPFSVGRPRAAYHRQICDKAGLPKDMTFTGFRHGGITEIGASGEADVRAVSGHKTLGVTAIYNKATLEKARQIAHARRQHIERLGGDISGGVGENK